MSLYLHFETISASTFFNWVGIQAQKMNKRYSDRGVYIQENLWGDDISLWVQPWRGAPEEDGRWSFEGEIIVLHPDNAQPEYDGQEYLASGLLRFEAVTDGFQEMGPGITVTVDYDPSQEIPTVLPYVVELFDLVETKTGTVMRQLAEQDEVLRRVIRQRAGAQPRDEDTSAESLATLYQEDEGTLTGVEQLETVPEPHPSLIDARGLFQDRQAVLEGSDRARDYYEPATACAVATALVECKKKRPYKKLGPKLVSQYCRPEFERHTVGHYFQVFRELGIQSIENVNIPPRRRPRSRPSR